MRVWRSVAFAVVVLGVLLSCDSARRMAGTLGELKRVQAAVATATAEKNVGVNVNNDRFLTVSLINSPLKHLGSDEKRAKAREVARIAYETYMSRSELETVRVVFVVQRRYFGFFNYTDATDGVAFRPDELRPPTTAPSCVAEPNRKAEQVKGELIKGQTFSRSVNGWILRLLPIEGGWFLEVAMDGRESDDLSRLTPPWHGVPNPRDIEGWHFRNGDNTGPNDGSVNAPGELREFIFSPEVGRGIKPNGSVTTAEDVAKVQSFGRGWVHVDQFELTPVQSGERASFERLRFTACLTWPVG
jgi:hypothetical protein